MKRCNSIKALIAITFASACVAHNILDFGAIVDETSVESESTNAYAFTQAILAANSSLNEDNTVEISAGQTFSLLPISVDQVSNIDFKIDGTLLASKNFRAWNTTSIAIANFLHFEQSENLTFSGTGVVDG